MADIGGRQDPDTGVGYQDPVGRTGRSPIVRTDAGVLALSVSRSIYSRRVVLAAAYKLSDRWATLVDDEGPERWTLYLVGLTPEGADAGLTLLIQELNDQAIRERLDDETRDLRTLIVAQAFSEGNLLDPTRDSEDPTVAARSTGTHRPR